ncbi:MAG: hypothetical protein KAQ94_06235 [Arcobacteraceae bacterium]|nr:hypothetical protein [Arcobacteraceae bacterium]
MNSKKSIVLLITLFFISAISILILQNLKDTEQFLDELSSGSSLSQIQITIDNVREEVPKYLNKNKDDIDEILNNTQVVALQVGNVDILLNIEDYSLTQFNINNLTTKMTSSEDFTNNINYKYDFLEIVNEHKKEGNYTNTHQIQQTIKEYIKLTKDKDILNIKDEFTYLKDINGTKLIQCNYSIKVNEESCDVSFIFDLSSSTVKDFNIINIF